MGKGRRKSCGQIFGVVRCERWSERRGASGEETEPAQRGEERGQSASAKAWRARHQRQLPKSRTEAARSSSRRTILGCFAAMNVFFFY